MGCSIRRACRAAVFRNAGRDICARFPGFEAAHRAAGDCGWSFAGSPMPNSFIRLEDGRLHVRMSPICSKARRRRCMEALAYILIGKLYRQAGGAHLRPPLPSVLQPAGHPAEGATGAADPRPKVRLRTGGRKPQPGGDFRALESRNISTGCWDSRCWGGAAGRRAGCWGTSIRRITPLSSAGFSIARPRRRWRSST